MVFNNQLLRSRGTSGDKPAVATSDGNGSQIMRLSSVRDMVFAQSKTDFRTQFDAGTTVAADTTARKTRLVIEWGAQQWYICAAAIPGVPEASGAQLDSARRILPVTGKRICGLAQLRVTECLVDNSKA